MRPQTIFPYFALLTSLKGVGPRLSQIFETLLGMRIRDLLFHLPVGVMERRKVASLADAMPGERIIVRVRVDSHKAGPTRKVPYRVMVSDYSGFMTLVFFHGRGHWLAKQLPEGEERLISGVVEEFRGEKQMSHPDYMGALSTADQIPEAEPVYPLSYGLSNKVLRKTLSAAFDAVPPVKEWGNPALVARESWPDFLAALKAAHYIKGTDDIDPASSHRRRLAYDELLADQFAIALVRGQMKARRGRSLAGSGALVDDLRASIPYTLTDDQQNTFVDIKADLEADAGMLRLVQGDVGSGKTVVALLAALHAIEAGTQVALLAPTEILARQHYDTVTKLVEPLGVRAACLTGSTKKADRADILPALADGSLSMIVGTHALFQDEVHYKDLALAIIDEQHRFGVGQRMALAAKSRGGIDILGMTATPIPRTLTLALYGDMDVSRIQEKPPGRSPIDTRVVSKGRLDDVVAGLQRAMAEGQGQAYWVCPLVTEEESSDLVAAETRYESLRKIFGDRVGLLHGQMHSREKDKVMKAFSSGSLDILVATTVIEVGVDVPAASIMVIEHAERFGLAQLHQLRGRVGRGATASRCILLRSDSIGEVAQERLRVIRDSEDGFFLAEEDLRLRGAGEILGTRQSGLPSYHFVDWAVHGDLIEIARSDARLLAERDGLNGPRGEALRELLYLFDRDEGVRRLLSG